MTLIQQHAVLGLIVLISTSNPWGSGRTQRMASSNVSPPTGHLPEAGSSRWGRPNFSYGNTDVIESSADLVAELKQALET